MLQPHRGLFCAGVPPAPCKGRGLATAAGLDPEQGCAHSARPLCAKTSGTALSLYRFGFSQVQGGVSPEPPHPCPSCWGSTLTSWGRGTAALSGKAVNYSQAQSGFPHRH